MHGGALFLVGGLFFMAIPWLPYRNAWMVDLKPIRRRLAAGEKVRRSDLFLLRINQGVLVVLVLGGLALVIDGFWRLAGRG